MESNDLTTRTYTAPTCTLIVSSKRPQLSRLDILGVNSPQRQQKNAVDFILYLDDPDREEQELVTLIGQPQQLERLQQLVSEYVAELVAKFPLPNSDRNLTPKATQSQQIDTTETSIESQLYPNRQTPAPMLGLMKNLPGLRNNLPQSPPESTPDTPSQPTAKLSISKLLRGWTKPKNRPGGDPTSNSGLEHQVTSRSLNHPPTPPYLTGSDRALDHQFHLGDLATATSGAVTTLSAIQLFDLATVLDEYVTEGVTPIDRTQPITIPSGAELPEQERWAPQEHQASMFDDGGNQIAAVDPTATPLSRLPNLPKIPAAAPTSSQIYYRTRRSRSSFVSALPWATAAAVAVCVPLLLLDSRSNPLKELTSKVKMPDLAAATKSVTDMLPGEKATAPSSTNNGTAVPNQAGLPKPWQARTIQPPQSKPKPLDVGVQPSQTPSKIGIAPLPDAIVGKSGQDLLNTASSLGGTTKPGAISSPLPNKGTQSSLAPNPLNSTQSPSDLNGMANLTGATTTNPSPTTISKSGRVAASKDRPIRPKTTVSQPAKLPIELIEPGNVSISKQPISIPSNLPPIDNKTSSITQKPFNPIDTGISQSPQKTTKPKVKPTTVASKIKPKPVKSNGQAITPKPSFEPFTPVPKNPNLINPEQSPNSTQGSETQAPPVIPNQPLQPNQSAVFGPNPADNPALLETKRYFQGKWKANPNQPNSLQYVVQVNGNGTVRSVEAQGEAANSYLQQTKLIKTGQKLISPGSGSSDQKIRVLLEPDGNVDAFIEP